MNKMEIFRLLGFMLNMAICVRAKEPFEEKSYSLINGKYILSLQLEVLLSKTFKMHFKTVFKLFIFVLNSEFLLETPKLNVNGSLNIEIGQIDSFKKLSVTSQK